MEAPCLCPSQGHKYGAWKLTKTYIFEKKAISRLLRAHKHLYEYLFSYKDHSDCKISADKSHFYASVNSSSAHPPPPPGLTPGH